MIIVVWIIVAGVCLITVLVFVYQISPMMLVTIASGTNDLERARQTFLDLAQEANQEIVIYDDGNNMTESFYDDENFVQEVETILAGKEEAVTVRCLFNTQDQTAFWRLYHLPKVDIRFRPEPRPKSDVHFKIVDGGILAYLSRHDLGDSRRKFRLIDCRPVPRYARRSVKQEMVGEYLDRFEQAFRKATSVKNPA